MKNYFYVRKFDNAIDINIVRRKIVREAMKKVLNLEIEFLMHGKKEIVLDEDVTLLLKVKTRADFERKINALKSEIIRISSDTWDYREVVNYRLQLIFASIIVSNEKEIRKQLEGA